MTENTSRWHDNKNVENQICRFCMTITDLLIPIFEGEGLEQQLEIKIHKHLPIKLSSSDILPQQLCFQCASTLIAWDSLTEVCMDTDKKLRSVIGVAEDKVCESVEAKENNSDDEPLRPPKKRKLPDLKRISDNISEKPVRKKPQTRSKRKLRTKESRNAAKKKKANEIKQDDSENNSDCREDSKELISSIKTEVSESDGEAFDNSEDFDKGSLENAVKCEYCEKMYKDKKYLTRHVKKAHDDAKPFEAQRCDICGNIYKTKANLERHYTKEHLNNQVECPVCHLSINSKKMDSHLRSVHGVKTENENEERFKCKFCDKWFKNKYIRNSHVKEVHLSEPMKCKLCDFEGVHAVLRRHRRDVHAEKRFPCSLCSGAFKTLHTLKMHMTSHSDLRCYTCDICGMGFKRLNNVRDHMKCHEQKSNQCQICGNFFARKRYLAIHEKTIHNFYADGVIPEEKGFECGTCGAKLKWKKNLLAHMRIHTGEKPYVCKICKKDFICHGSLRTHMAKHGVCGASDNVMSPITDGIQDSQNRLTIEMSVFNHYNPPQV